MGSTELRFAVVTPARNEAPRIAATIAAMRAQTVRPERWVIVDDGSDDRTGDVARAAAQGADWIVTVRREPSADPGFASKVRAFRRGLEALDGVDHDLLANLDADVTFDADYFERLAAEFANRTSLGVAGGRIVVDVDGHRHDHRSSPNNVSGAVQCIRRRCYDDVGGFLLLERGGEDAALQITARSRGWEVDTIDELVVVHHGPVLNRQTSLLAAFWSRGIVNRGLGYDPAFMAVSSIYRFADRPYVVGGLAYFAGFMWALVRGAKPVLPADTAAFLRVEQRTRLRRLVPIGARGG